MQPSRHALAAMQRQPPAAASEPAPAPMHDAGADEGAPPPSWFPTRSAGSAVPIYDLRSGSYVHTPRSKKAARPRQAAPAQDAAVREAAAHHGVAARNTIRPTFTKAVRRPVDELARQPAALHRRGKLPLVSAEARHAATLSRQVAFEARFEPLVPTSDDLIPRCGDRGPRVINAPWGGMQHGDSWAAALCGGRAATRPGDAGAFARD